MDHSTRPNKQVVSPLPGEHDVTITKIFKPEDLDMAAAVEALCMLLREPSVVQPIDAHRPNLSDGGVRFTSQSLAPGELPTSHEVQTRTQSRYHRDRSQHR